MSKKCKDHNWKIILRNGECCTASFVGVSTAEGVRQFLNGGQQENTTLRQFVSIGKDIVLNKDQIIAVSRNVIQPRWYIKLMFWRAKKG